MKLQRYRFESAVQEVSEHSIQWLENELRAILESNKAFESKCDYIGYSILSIDDKVELLDSQIKELQSYKTRLKSAKNIAVSTTARVFGSYGISKIEGGGISSITVTPESKKLELDIKVNNEEALVDAGFYKKVLDMALVKKYYECGEYNEIINKYCTIELQEVVSVSKIRINKRRSGNNQMNSLEFVMQHFDKEAS